MGEEEVATAPADRQGECEDDPVSGVRAGGQRGGSVGELPRSEERVHVGRSVDVYYVTAAGEIKRSVDDTITVIGVIKPRMVATDNRAQQWIGLHVEGARFWGKKRSVVRDKIVAHHALRPSRRKMIRDRQERNRRRNA